MCRFQAGISLRFPVAVTTLLACFGFAALSD